MSVLKSKISVTSEEFLNNKNKILSHKSWIKKIVASN